MQRACGAGRERRRSFEKAVAIDGKRETCLTGDTTVDYAEVKDQTLLYRITLVTSADESGEIVFEDTLPEGTAWGTGGGNNKLFVDGVQQNWYNGGWQITSAPDAALLLACGRVRRRKEETK